MTIPVETSETATPASPWMTVKEAAVYSRRHYQTVLHALQDEELAGFQDENAKTGGRRGCRWKVHRTDVDRWMQGLAPRKATRLRTA